MPNPQTQAVEVHCAHDAMVDTAALIPNPRNPNTHPDKQIALLAKIITLQGWRAPITVSNRSGFIVRGHGRLMAAKAAGLEVCPVDYQDYENEAAEILDMLMDNGLQPRVGMQRNRWGRVLEGMRMCCMRCGKWFYMRPSELGRVFCSTACARAHSRVYPKQEYECKFCGRVFTGSEKPHSNSPHTYCSLVCRDLAYRELKGPSNPNWQGGKGTEHQRIRQTAAYAEWRHAVYVRDDYTCQECGARGVRLHAHHIKPFAGNPTLRTDVTNGVTLCLECHGKKHNKAFAAG